MYIPYSILKMSPQISILKFHGTGIPEPSETADHILKITGNGSRVYVCACVCAPSLVTSRFQISGSQFVPRISWRCVSGTRTVLGIPWLLCC